MPLSYIQLQNDRDAIGIVDGYVLNSFELMMLSFEKGIIFGSREVFIPRNYFNPIKSQKPDIQ